MSFERLPVSLRNYEVGLSGAVPERHAWSEPAMDRGILEFVSNFSALVFKYGGRIVHGFHPTFTPIILRQARLHAGKRTRKPLTLVMSDLWARDLNKEDVQSTTDVAEFIVTRKVGDGGPDDADTRKRSLTVMRRVLVNCQNVMVAVGGKMHSADGKAPGLGEEMDLAGEKSIPRFVIAGLGGFAGEYAKGLTPGSLNNALSDENNIRLIGSSDVAACVSLLFDHMAESEMLRESTSQPVGWDPQLTQYVVHAIN